MSLLELPRSDQRVSRALAALRHASVQGEEIRCILAEPSPDPEPLADSSEE